MGKNNTLKVFYTFACLILAIGVISFAVSGTKEAALLGLLIGGAVSGINYLLLILMMKFLAANKAILAVPAYIIRLLLYLITAFFAVNLGDEAAITFSMSIIAIAFSLFIVYGLGGMREKEQ